MIDMVYFQKNISGVNVVLVQVLHHQEGKKSRLVKRTAADHIH